MHCPMNSVSSRARIFSSDDLPEPFTPMTPMWAPWKKERLTSSSTVLAPCCLVTLTREIAYSPAMWGGGGVGVKTGGRTSGGRPARRKDGRSEEI